jgi:hypothetical protein
LCFFFAPFRVRGKATKKLLRSFINYKKQILLKKNPLLSDNMWKDASGIIFSNAKKLRENPTQAEEVMWSSLSNNQLDGCKFRRQH